MTPEELKGTGQKLFKSGQYAEAMPLLKSAAEALPNDEALWSELVIAARESGQHEQAVEFAKLGIRHHPRSDWLWRTLGSEFVEVDKLDEAEKALNTSRTLNSAAPWLWRYFIKLHQRHKNYVKEIEAWQNLRDLDTLSATDLNCLGIAYHNHGNYAKAVQFYHQSAAKSDSAAAFFNMGLVFNHPEVSQDADAADAYRRAIILNPENEKAKERLEATKQKLLPLAKRARSETGSLIRPEEFFQFYVNPFELFPIEFNGGLSKLDPKAIHRARKRLLGEIELNDGKVEWLENQEIDRARALALEDELHDEKKGAFIGQCLRTSNCCAF
jgi:tetratricopeptide (TPR) repeat protein